MRPFTLRNDSILNCCATTYLLRALRFTTGHHDPSDLGTKNIGLTNPVPSSGTLDIAPLAFRSCTPLIRICAVSWPNRGEGGGMGGVVRNWRTGHWLPASNCGPAFRPLGAWLPSLLSPSRRDTCAGMSWGRVLIRAIISHVRVWRFAGRCGSWN